MLMPIALESLEDSGSSLGSPEDPSRGVSSLSSSCSASTTASGQRGRHPGISAFPSGLLPAEKHRRSSGALGAKGRRPGGKS